MYPRGSAARYSAGGLGVQVFHEAKPGAAPAASLAGLELVGEGLDDRDSEAALGKSLVHRTVAGSVESGAVVCNLDDKPVGLQLVQDLDRPLAVLIAVPDRVRAGLRHGELQVAEGLLAEGTESRQAAQ